MWEISFPASQILVYLGVGGLRRKTPLQNLLIKLFSDILEPSNKVNVEDKAVLARFMEEYPRPELYKELRNSITCPTEG